MLQNKGDQRKFWVGSTRHRVAIFASALERKKKALMQPLPFNKLKHVHPSLPTQHMNRHIVNHSSMIFHDMCRRRTIFFPSTVKVSKTSLSIGTFHRAFTNKTSSKLDTCSEFSSIGSWSRLIFDTLSIRHGVESPQKTSLLRVPKPLKSKTNLMRLPLSWSLTLRR